MMPYGRGLVLAMGLVASACDAQIRGAFAADSGGALPPGATPVDTSAPPAPRPALLPPQPVPGPVGARTEPVSFSPIVHFADPSVVTINTVSEDVEISPFTHRGRPREMRGLGTGFVVDKGGVVVTNNHVVDGADSIQVKLFDEREYPGKVVGTDPATDIAVVRINAKDLQPLPLGDSSRMDVGDWVVAIGNPFGLSHTVSAGIISAKGRTRQDVPLDPAGYYDFLQTDASINPGNSGGPLLNLRGEVVGINTAVRGGGAQGIGFAIPIDMVKLLLPMLLRDGHVTRSALGVRIVDVHQLTNDDRTALGLVDGARVSGAVVEYVVPAGPAQRAGLAPGDIIVGFNDQVIERSAQLQWLASTAGVGRTVALRILRASKEFELKLTLAQLADEPPAQGGPGLAR